MKDTQSFCVRLTRRQDYDIIFKHSYLKTTGAVKSVSPVEETKATLICFVISLCLFDIERFFDAVVNLFTNEVKLKTWQVKRF